MNAFLEATLGQWPYIIRICIAVLCGSAIGLERSRRQKEAGIRTHIILCVGASILMIISKYGFFDILELANSEYINLRVDGSRIASTIITGVSFLGAGVIYLKGTSIKGLTTPAGVFATASVGMAIGSGMYTVGIFSTVLIVFIQYFLHKYNLSSESVTASEIRIKIEGGDEGIDEIKKFLSNTKIIVDEFHIITNPDGTITYEAFVKHLDKQKSDKVVDLKKVIPGIKEISVIE